MRTSGRRTSSAVASRSITEALARPLSGGAATRTFQALRIAVNRELDELVEALAARTDGVLAMGQSTLYPMLYNLEAKGLIEAEWRDADSGRGQDIRIVFRISDGHGLFDRDAQIV